MCCQFLCHYFAFKTSLPMQSLWNVIKSVIVILELSQSVAILLCLLRVTKKAMVSMICLPVGVLCMSLWDGVSCIHSSIYLLMYSILTFGRGLQCDHLEQRVERRMAPRSQLVTKSMITSFSEVQTSRWLLDFNFLSHCVAVEENFWWFKGMKVSLLFSLRAKAS